MISLGQKIKVFISSICGVEKCDKVRDELKNALRQHNWLMCILLRVKVFLHYLQDHIIDIKRTAKELDISYNTAATAVKKLLELGILQEVTNAARNRVFAYEEYLGILRKDM